MNCKQTIGVVAISYNEEEDLPGFLENLIDWVDEIVIVDDGSCDKTAEIAGAAGPKVRFIHQERTSEEGFSGQRNRGLDEIKTDWVLNMDIDERVPPDLREEMLNAITNTKRNAYRYRRLNFFLHRPMKRGGWDSWNHPQLARRGRHRYENKLHEVCVVDGDPQLTGQLHAKMYHFNDENYEERLRKSFQYCKLEAETIIANGSKVKWRHLLLIPVAEFVRKYLLKWGMVDGVPGLISAVHAACATFRAYAIAWDRQNHIPREELENGIGKQSSSSAVKS